LLQERENMSLAESAEASHSLGGIALRLGSSVSGVQGKIRSYNAALAFVSFGATVSPPP